MGEDMSEHDPTKTLVDLRAERGLRIQDVADLCGLSTTTVCYLEQGARPARLVTVAKLARGLGVTPEEVRAMLRASLLDAATRQAEAS
jgi:transcriptional regulator with XRE-family HTH domain